MNERTNKLHLVTSPFISSPTNSVFVGLAFLILIFLGGVGFRSDTLPYPPQAEYSDASISRYPDALHFQRSIRNYQTIPLWNPHLMGGQPFAANPGTKTWYPLTWFLLIWSPAFHINFMLAIHLWLGGVGMWLWGRRTGLGLWGALLASIAYMLAPKLVAHGAAGHTDILIAMGWMPWLLYMIHRGIIERIRPAIIVGLAFVATMILMGAIQLLPYLYGTAAIYALALIWGSPKARKLTDFAPFLLAGILLIAFSAVIWLPLLELSDELSRGAIEPEDAAIFSLKPAQFLGLIVGNHGGGAEQLTYVGVSVLVLAITGWLLRMREKRLWWLIVVFAGLYAMGEHFALWTSLVAVFPPLLWFRVPSRIWLLAALALPYLAGWGLQYLLEAPPSGRTARLWLVGFMGIGISCSLGSWLFLVDLETSALLGLIALPLTGLLLAVVVFGKGRQAWVIPAFIALVALDLLWINVTLIEGRDDWLQSDPPDLIAYLMDTGGRIYTPDYAIPQQNTAYWGIARFDGIDPFQLANFTEEAAQLTGVPLRSYSTTVPPVVVDADDADTLRYQDANIDAQGLGEWGVEWVIAGYELDVDGLTLVRQIEGNYFYRNAYAWTDDTHLYWETPNRCRQEVERTGDLHTITHASGWRVADGKMPDMYDQSLPPLNATFVYSPRGVYVGLMISFISILFASIWVLWSHRLAP